MTEEELFEELLESDQTDPEVQYQLGCCYLKGKGVGQDGQQAQRWLRRAADQGHEAALELLSAGEPAPEGLPEAALTAQTLPDWCVAAEDGDDEAQYQVAMFFLEQGAAGAAGDAERYLAMAAEQGHPRACLTLAKRRQGQERYEEAVALLQNAADCGLPEAMGLLAVCYGQGWGVEQDVNEAELWFTRAADLGSGEDKLALALRYKTGDLVPMSPARALSWLRRAQDAGVADAEERYYAEDRAREAQERELEERRRRQEERRKAKEKEQEALQRAQEKELEERCQALLAQGSDAAWETARQIMDNRVVEDAGLAVRVLSVLVEQGHAEAQNTLGCCYERGFGVKQGYAKAFDWYRKSAEQGYSMAQRNVGLYYEKGWHVKQDYAQAAAWYRKAAEQGHEDAMVRLGYAYAHGQGVEQNYALALVWYRKLAEQGSGHGVNNLGACYEYGWGVEQDYAQAEALYRKAAELGNEKGKENLQKLLDKKAKLEEQERQEQLRQKAKKEQEKEESRKTAAVYVVDSYLWTILQMLPFGLAGLWKILGGERIVDDWGSSSLLRLICILLSPIVALISYAMVVVLPIGTLYLTYRYVVVPNKLREAKRTIRSELRIWLIVQWAMTAAFFVFLR